MSQRDIADRAIAHYYERAADAAAAVLGITNDAAAELARLNAENAELRRERDDLIDQRIRADELWAENQELRATVRRYENRGRGGS